MYESRQAKNNSSIKLFHLVNNLHQALFRVSDKGLAGAAGISSTQGAVLMYLLRETSAPIGRVATSVGIKLTSASGLVDRMVAKGLVLRSRSARDARTVMLSLTAKGQSLAQDIRPKVQQMNAALLNAGGTDDEIRIFRMVCNRLISASERLTSESLASKSLTSENITSENMTSENLRITADNEGPEGQGISHDMKMKRGAS